MLQEAKLELKKSKRKDYYKILGVEKSANEDEIKKAYRKRAMVHHPDRHSSASEDEKKDHETKFKEVSESERNLKCKFFLRFRSERLTPSSVTRRRGGCTTVARTWRMGEDTASTTSTPTVSSRHSLEEAWVGWVGWEDNISSSVELPDMVRASVFSSAKDDLDGMMARLASLVTVTTVNVLSSIYQIVAQTCIKNITAVKFIG